MFGFFQRYLEYERARGLGGNRNHFQNSLSRTSPQLNPYMATMANEVLENPSPANEVLENPSLPEEAIVEQENHEIPASEMPNHGCSESQPIFPEEEVRNTLETSASTGKFWQDWEKLKSILSYHLKQVLLEYPEAKMTSEQQVSSLGETFQEVVKRLDDALCSFDEGPPFTLQRLCEILLSARSIYPKLSKLSLALEKNLLVTSTLTISDDPYPLLSNQDSNGSHKGNGDALPQMNTVQQNGVEAAGDRDEVMADAQETPEGGGSEDITMEMETIEDTVPSSEANPTPTDGPHSAL